jgi:hypothetical protein
MPYALLWTLLILFGLETLGRLVRIALGTYDEPPTPGWDVLAIAVNAVLMLWIATAIS